MFWFWKYDYKMSSLDGKVNNGHVFSEHKMLEVWGNLMVKISQGVISDYDFI